MCDHLSIERLPGPNPGTAVLRLAGSMDGHGGRAVMNACAGLRAEGSSVVLVLQDITFISSSGVGVLLALTEDFQDRELTLRIAAPSKEVRMAIGLLNLDHYLRIHDTEEEALRAAAA